MTAMNRAGGATAEIRVVGRCTCGDVRFFSSAEPLFHGYCHCQHCRDATGNPVSEIAFFETDQSGISGATTTWDYVLADGTVTHRDACRRCGAFIFDRSDRFPHLVGVIAARLQGMTSRPSFHMWTSRMLPKVEIADGLPAFSGRPDSSAIRSQDNARLSSEAPDR